MLSVITLVIDPHQLLGWAVVCLVAGVVGTRVMLGRGLGIFADVLVGIGGALVGGFLAGFFGVNFSVPGPPIVTEMVVALVGSFMILAVLRLLGFERRRSNTVSGS
jgi:uncharacterized membrane protein YeaQ/YmgE (transglycosylase-associated protein family)